MKQINGGMPVVWLVVLVVLGILLWNGRKRPNTPPHVINQQWMDYLAVWYREAKKPVEKKQLKSMIEDLLAQGMPHPQESLGDDMLSVQSTSIPVSSSAHAKAARYVATEPVAAANAIVQTAHEPIDNATLLLYFGAFLFLAAAGLFVALAGENGTLRVGVITLTATALYFGGMWLHRTKPKLLTPAYTFVGMGMMLAPLAGLATYAYVLKDYGPAVWFATSAICLALYTHALQVLRTSLIEYIFLGTFVSLFESSVSILNLPVHYYGWMLALVGLLLQIWLAMRKKAIILEEPVPLMSNLLVPGSLVAAFYLIPTHGVWQMGISALLASLYYGLQAWRSTGDNRLVSAVLAEIAANVGVACVAFAVRENYVDVAVALTGLAVLETVLLSWLLKGLEPLRQNSVSLQVITIFIAMFLAWSSPVVVLVITVIFVLISGFEWVRQQRPELHAISMVGILALPYIYSWAVVDPPLDKPALTGLVYAAVASQVTVFLLATRRRLDTDEWRHSVRGILMISMVVLFLTAIGIQQWWLVGIGALLALTAYLMHSFDSFQNLWLAVSGVAVAVPVLFVWQDTRAFLAATLIAWGWNLVLALEHRAESARWLGTAAWLLLPVAVQHHWTWLHNSTWYTVAYLIAMVGLVVARTIAKDRLATTIMPLAELEKRLKSESLAYVAGYGIAAVVAYATSFGGGWWLPSLSGIVITLMTYLVARRVELSADLLAAVPVLAQLAIPGIGSYDIHTNWFILVGSLVAVTLYAFATSRTSSEWTGYKERLQQGALIAAFLPAAWVVVTGEAVPAMPITLFAAGALLMHFVWRRTQQEREVAGGVMTLAIMWGMNVAGVTNIQAYAHVLAALLSLYAYWRAKRSETREKDGYIVAALSAATVPLAMQLLSGVAGDVYGWWFLCEQIGIMLVGMAIGNKFVMRWGMYVAVAAVLYQLRDLAWLALAALAVFLIGLAIYSIQKSENK